MRLDLGSSGKDDVQALAIVQILIEVTVDRSVEVLGCPNVRGIDSSFIRRVGASWAT